MDNSVKQHNRLVALSGHVKYYHHQAVTRLTWCLGLAVIFLILASAFKLELDGIILAVIFVLVGMFEFNLLKNESRQLKHHLGKRYVR